MTAKTSTNVKATDGGRRRRVARSSRGLARQIPIYGTFVKNTERIYEFITLTKVSYGLSAHLLAGYPKGSLPPFELKDFYSEEEAIGRTSYSMSDVAIEKTVLKGGWVTLAEYAKLSGQELSAVKEAAKAGHLGPVEYSAKRRRYMLIWPPDKQALPKNELPDVGKRTYEVVLRQTLGVGVEIDPTSKRKNRGEVRQYLLQMANELGNYERVIERASTMLFRSAFLLQWTVFEVFLRDLVAELLSRHPEKLLASKRRREGISYEQLFSLSMDLNSIESLRQGLIDQELDALRSGGRSVHGLINFLKSEFEFEVDPYRAWYIMDGQRYEATYGELMAAKDRRNALVHEMIGNPDPKRAGRERTVSEDEYYRLRLALKAVCFSIARSVGSGRYSSS